MLEEPANTHRDMANAEAKNPFPYRQIPQLGAGQTLEIHGGLEEIGGNDIKPIRCMPVTTGVQFSGKPEAPLDPRQR